MIFRVFRNAPIPWERVSMLFRIIFIIIIRPVGCSLSVQNPRRRKIVLLGIIDWSVNSFGILPFDERVINEVHWGVRRRISLIVLIDPVIIMAFINIHRISFELIRTGLVAGIQRMVAYWLWRPWLPFFFRYTALRRSASVLIIKFQLTNLFNGNLFHNYSNPLFHCFHDGWYPIFDGRNVLIKSDF